LEANLSELGHCQHTEGGVETRKTCLIRGGENKNPVSPPFNGQRGGGWGGGEGGFMASIQSRGGTNDPGERAKKNFRKKREKKNVSKRSAEKKTKYHDERVLQITPSMQDRKKGQLTWRPHCQGGGVSWAFKKKGNP